MEYVVIAFRSRSHTIKISEIFSGYGIKNEIINTPKEAGVGCGLSVKISTANLGFAKKVVYSLSLPSLAGFFLIKGYGGSRTIRSI